MDAVLPATFALGFVIGLKHAFEPDHVIAISTLLHQEPRLKRAMRTGVAWGAGHTTMLIAGVLIMGLLRVPLSESTLKMFEIPVGIMLLLLGVWALYIAVDRFLHMHRHSHDGVEHFHVGEYDHPHGFSFGESGWHAYAIGLVHGLAGSGALLLLVAATLPTLATSVLYALVFGVGSIAGMAGVTLLLAVPFLATRSRPGFFHALTGASGILSIFLGGSILYSFW